MQREPAPEATPKDFLQWTPLFVSSNPVGIMQKNLIGAIASMVSRSASGRKRLHIYRK
jgi:hypothetical protein